MENVDLDITFYFTCTTSKKRKPLSTICYHTLCDKILETVVLNESVLHTFYGGNLLQLIFYYAICKSFHKISFCCTHKNNTQQYCYDEPLQFIGNFIRKIE